jgi:SAM-dependent methyltransferase
MRWVECGTCGHILTDGYFGEAASEVLLSRINQGQRLGDQIEALRTVSARMVARVCEYQFEDDPGSWLDIGAGSGSLLFTAQEFGFSVVGTDLREEVVQGLRRLGIGAHRADIAMLDPGVKYSVISMADVLEHMPYPKAALEKAYTLLSDWGTLLISCPAYDCQVWRYLDARQANPYWAELEHYHNFSRERLYKLLTGCGFFQFSYGVSERYRCGMEILARKHL